MIFLGLLLWYLIGCVGFIYWWTKDHDYTTTEIILTLLIGISGPISWIIGASLHSDLKVIFKRRK
jgi:hypothetical protein